MFQFIFRSSCCFYLLDVPPRRATRACLRVLLLTKHYVYLILCPILSYAIYCQLPWFESSCTYHLKQQMSAWLLRNMELCESRPDVRTLYLECGEFSKAGVIVTSWRLCLWHTDKHILISCQNSFMYVSFVLLGRWTLNYRRSLVYSCWHFRSLQWSWYIYLKLSRDRECYIMLAGCCKATSCFYCMTRSAWEASTMAVPDFDSATCGSLWQCWISHLNKVSERVLFINKQADAPTRDWTRFGYKCG